MPPGFEDDRSCTGLLQRGVLGEEVLAFGDVAPWTGGVQELGSRFQAVLLPADVTVRLVIIRRRADLHGTLTGWLLLRRDGHLRPPFIMSGVHVEDDAQNAGLFQLKSVDI